MLRIAGYLNIIIAFAHIIGLYWAQQLFEKTGAADGMEALAQVSPSLPYLLTIFVAIIFFVFGLYGLSAGGIIRRLPFLKFGIYTIAFIYIFRGIGELLYNLIQGTTSTSETVQSIVALIVGLLFLVGGLQKWKWKIV